MHVSSVAVAVCLKARFSFSSVSVASTSAGSLAPLSTTVTVGAVVYPVPWRRTISGASPLMTVRSSTSSHPVMVTVAVGAEVYPEPGHVSSTNETAPWPDDAPSTFALALAPKSGANVTSYSHVAALPSQVQPEPALTTSTLLTPFVTPVDGSPIGIPPGGQHMSAKSMLSG